MCIRDSSGNHSTARRRLDGDFVHLPRYLLAQSLDQGPTHWIGSVLVHDEAERVDRLSCDEDVETHHRAGLEVLHLVVERRVSLCAGLEQVEEVEHDLGPVSYTHLTLPTILRVEI